MEKCKICGDPRDVCRERLWRKMRHSGTPFIYTKPRWRKWA